MNIVIEKKNFETLNIEPLKEKCGQALDLLWSTDWMRFAIAKGDRRNLASLQEISDKLARQSDIVVVLASGDLAKLIKAAVSAAAPKEERAEVIVFGDTLSPADYAGLFEKLENRTFSLLPVTCGEESLQLTGAYTVLKHLLVSRFGKEQAAERIAAVAGPKSKVFAKAASEEDFPLTAIPDVSPQLCANMAAVLLPLGIKGVDLVEYLDGFYEMLASPAWDLDAVDYAVGCAAWGKEEILQVWQSQLLDFAKFQGRGVQLPAGEEGGGEAFETLLICQRDTQDVMMPYFEGCSEDGSLNLLMLDEAEKRFANENPGVKLSMETMNDYNLGQLFAFFQLSKGITEILAMYENK